MEKEYLLEILNYNLDLVWFVLTVLVLKNIFHILKGNKWKFKTLGRKHFSEFFQKMGTPLFGLVIMLISFALTNALLGGAANIPPIVSEAETNAQSLKEAFLSFGYTGFFGVVLFITSGAFYIFSGFGPWMKWVARAFMLAAIFYIFIQMFRYAVLAA